MTSQFAKLLALTTAPIVCAGFATMPDAAGQQDVGAKPDSGPLSSSRLVSNDELSQMRGGFFTAAGAQFDFGASVQTLVNGKLALQTNVQWTQAGAVTQQLQGLGSAVQAQVSDTVATRLANAGIATPGSSVQTTATGNSTPATPLAAPMPATDTANSPPPPSATATAVPAASLATNAPTASAPAASTPALASAPASSAPAAAAPTTSLATNSPAAPAAPPASVAANSPAASSAASATPAATAAPVTVAANAPAAGAAPMVLTGVQIPGASGGLTQIFANIAGGQIQNVILNSASGQDITQNTNITMTIYNFAAWQQQVAQNMLSGRLASDMMAASGMSVGH